VKRSLAALAVALLLASGASAAKPKPAPPSARDKAAARAFVVAADAFMKGLDDSKVAALSQVQHDLGPCSTAFAAKVDDRRMGELQSFLAEARALPQLPLLWGAMLARWDAVHTRNRSLRVVLAAARSQRGQVAKLGAGLAQPGICEALAAWEASAWANTYVADLEQGWNDSIVVDQEAMDAARSRVVAVAPQLTKLGLTREQVVTLIIATL
jgi:hypothetical protein